MVQLGYDHIVARVLGENRRAIALMASSFAELTTRRVGPALELSGRVRSPGLSAEHVVREGRHFAEPPVRHVPMQAVSAVKDHEPMVCDHGADCGAIVAA